MGYQRANGAYAHTSAVDMGVAAFLSDPAPAAVPLVKTATGTGPAIELGDEGTLRLTLNATAVTGTTPSMTTTIETSADGSTGWTSVGAFTAVTAVSSQRKIFTGLDRFVRFNNTITGTTPSFTYTLSGEAA